MRASRHQAPRCQAGFTLIEAVLVIVITGVVISMVAIFIVPATTAYFASSARAQLSDQADTALRRIGRDLALALPNSVRVSGSSIEIIPVSGAARYATESGNPLRFGVTLSSFDIVGPALTLAGASQRLAFYNLGAGVPDADAYTGANVRTASSGAGSATSVSLATTTALPNGLMAPPYRVYAIEQPVSYRCDTSVSPGTLTRYSGYGFLSVQPNPPGSGSSAVLARNVTGCSFTYDPATVAGRYALVSLRISLASNGETLTLYHAVHVDNLP